jgi:hypothetical protein
MSAKSFGRLFGALVLASGCSAAVANVAGAASIKIVLPAHVHASSNFSYSIKGTFSTSQLTGSSPKKAYVVVLRQRRTDACKSTEPKDWIQVGSSRLNYRGSQAHSPFSQTASWLGFSFARVCAYLYSRPFTQLGNAAGAKLLATRSATVPV